MRYYNTGGWISLLIRNIIHRANIEPGDVTPQSSSSYIVINGVLI